MGKYTVEFYEERCKGCRICVSVCPKNLLNISRTRINGQGYHPVAIENEALCVGCVSCALMCPDGAIRIEKGAAV